MFSLFTLRELANNDDDVTHGGKQLLPTDSRSMFFPRF